jgi:hypothetical protein
MTAAFHAFKFERGVPSYDNEIRGTLGNLEFSFPELEKAVKRMDHRDFSKNQNIRYISQFNDILIEKFAIGLDTINDNDCMFMSLAWWLHGTTRSANFVRNKVCMFLETMRNKPTEYPELADQIKETMAAYENLNSDDKSTFTENIKDVYPAKTCNNTSVRGNTWILKAAAQSYQVCIVVVQETSIRHPETKGHYKGTNQDTGKPRWLKYEISHIIKPEKITTSDIYKRLVWLYYDGSNHWNYLYYKTNPMPRIIPDQNEGERKALDSFVAISTLPEAMTLFKASLSHARALLLRDIYPGVAKMSVIMKEAWRHLHSLGLSEEDFLNEIRNQGTLSMAFVELGLSDDFFKDW